MTAEAKNKVVSALKELKGTSDLFIKVYFEDENNYTIKFIDTKTRRKVHTMRKSENRKVKGLDSEWWKKGGVENGKPQR